VHVFSDGACSGNPGPGGWAYLIRWGKVEKENSGGEAHTTNNRMELTAAARALQSLTRPCDVVVHTDSQYVVKGITEWIHGWRRKGWKNSQGKPVENRDLWEELFAATQPHTIKWLWVKGHAGHAENERVDALAVAAIPHKS
jgi:ribonuclease HI